MGHVALTCGSCGCVIGKGSCGMTGHIWHANGVLCVYRADQNYVVQKLCFYCYYRMNRMSIDWVMCGIET